MPTDCFDQHDIDCFINCLKKGTSHEMLTGENVVPLLELSDRFQTTWLFEACQAYIIKNLDRNSVMDLLKNVVIPYQLSEMMRACIHFLSKNFDSMPQNIHEIKEIAKKEGLVDLN